LAEAIRRDYLRKMASARTESRLSGILTIWLALALTGCQSSTGTQAQSAAKPQLPATILIIRHAEKLPNGDTDLSPAGYARAELLLKAFVPVGVRPDLPTPQYIFAATVSTHSNRSALTVVPLADALHLQINQDFEDHRYADLAAELLSGRYAGKVVLVSWHHGKIPQLATALGATPPYNPWPEQQFDRIWRIDYVGGKATLRDLPYAITPSDSK
jgi:hypothetical protein